jgi:16S rRNA processing protein RimM
MVERPRWIPIGKVLRAHGLRGLVKIFPYGETLAWKGPGDHLYAQCKEEERFTQLTVVSLKVHGKFWMGQFEELTSRDEVQGLIGAEIFLTEDLLAPRAEGEYYYYELIGLTVETTGGSRIGILRQILETGSHDVYVVEGRNGQEVLIPAVEQIVHHVDLEAGRMVVELPEGLMDAL